MEGREFYKCGVIIRLRKPSNFVPQNEFKFLYHLVTFLSSMLEENEGNHDIWKMQPGLEHDEGLELILNHYQQLYIRTHDVPDVLFAIIIKYLLITIC